MSSPAAPGNKSKGNLSLLKISALAPARDFRVSGFESPVSSRAAPVPVVFVFSACSEPVASDPNYSPSTSGSSAIPSPSVSPRLAERFFGPRRVLLCVAGAGVSGPGGFYSVTADKSPGGGSSLGVLAATVSTSPPSATLDASSPSSSLAGPRFAFLAPRWRLCRFFYCLSGEDVSGGSSDGPVVSFSWAVDEGAGGKFSVGDFAAAAPFLAESFCVFSIPAPDPVLPFSSPF